MKNKLPNLNKSEDPAGYAKLANEGLMIGFPVKINGHTHREDNGIGYHSTIKFFNPTRDHPHSIHQLAQNLPLNPPDAKNTQIEPGELKDRNGNTVYVLKLKGNSAEKIKEHNGKFAHMGDPQPYEYTPHISVPKSIHDKIKSSGYRTAKEAGIEFGPAELKRGPKTLKTYHHEPDSAEPKVPDESDFTAKATAKSEEIHGEKPLAKPFLSEAQRRWGHTAAGKKALGGNAGVHEWDEATKGKKLPEKVGKSLEKGALKTAGVALGMAGALAGAAPQTNPSEAAAIKQNAPVYDHSKMLNAISQVESSGGKNTDHKPMSNGQHAFGRYALTPDTIRDTIKADPELKAKHGKALALEGDTIHRYMQDHKGLEDVIANKHLSHLEQHFGNNPGLLGVAWLNGTSGTSKALKSGKDLSNHWYAQRVKQAYEK